MDLINDFEIYLRDVVGLQATTHHRYRRTLEKFASYCLKNNITLRTAKSKNIQSFLDSQEVGAAQLQHYLCVIRWYYNFLICREISHSNPAKQATVPKRTFIAAPKFSVEDVSALIGTCSNSRVGIRDRAMITLIYATGIRCSELANLKMIDVDLDNHTVKVFGKNSKERLVPLNAIAIESLSNYLTIRSQLLPRKANFRWLFVSQNQSSNKPISRVLIWKIIKTHAKKAGLDSRFTTHSLRHCFASHLIQHGANVRVIQDLLGHAKLSTTQIYAQLNNTQLKELHTLHHPRA